MAQTTRERPWVFPHVPLARPPTTVLAQVAVVIGDHFTLLAQPTIDFDASGVLGSITGGLGVNF